MASGIFITRSRRVAAVLLAAALLAALSVSRGAPAQTAAKTPAVAVVAGPVEVVPVRDEITAVGDLKADELVIMRPEIAGVIKSIPFAEGQRVEQGDLLFQFDDAVLRAELADAQANLELSQRNFQRSRELYEKRIGSERTRDETLAALQSWQAKKALAEARLEKTRVQAPFDGITGFRMVSPGAYVQAGQDMVRLVRIDPIKVDFQVPERFLSAVAPGQKVSVTLDSFPGKSFGGEVYALDNVVDVNGRAIAIRARIPNPDGVLRPGMFARVTLVTETRDKAVVVPETAIVPEAQSKFVFVVDDGKARKTEVETGRRLAGKVEVVSGLKAGDVIVTVGQQKIRDGSPVAPIEQKESS